MKRADECEKDEKNVKDVRLRKEKEKKSAEKKEEEEEQEEEKVVEEGEEIPNADRREGAPPLARAMPCRDRPVEC